MPLSLRFAARSDVGLVREGNEDSGYAGQHLLVVADGMGGHAAGEVASSVAVSTLAPLDEALPVGGLLDHLASAVHQANAQLREMSTSDPILEGMGTTLTAVLWTGTRMGLAHVGDSRAYVLRDGELVQMTRDHTFVQTLLDEGRLTQDEADQHPQRNLVTRALDGREDVEVDLSMREVRPGDRFLLCSDGLSGVVSGDTLREVLAAKEPDEAVHVFVELALRGGGPDNITCVVGEIVETETMVDMHPVVVGAATDETRPRSRRRGDSAASRAAALTPRRPRRSSEPREEPEQRDRRRWAAPAFLFLVLAALVVGVGYGGWSWARSQYYVGTNDGHVAIYRGVAQGVAGMDLSSVHKTDSLPLNALPAFERERVTNTISSNGLADAQNIVTRLRAQACAKAADDGPPPGRKPSPAPTAGRSPSPGGNAAGGGAQEGAPDAPSPEATSSPGTDGERSRTAKPTPSPTPVPTVPGVDCTTVEVQVP